jgi:hypothetical protein
MSTNARKFVWVAAFVGFAAFLGLLGFVALHADVYARQINIYSRIVGFLSQNVVFSAVGLFLTFCAGITTFKSVRLVSKGSLAQGTVVAYEFEEDCYLPVVEFSDRSGVLRRFTSATGKGNKPYQEGGRVTVLYNPAQPEQAAIRAFWTLWLFPVVLSAFGVWFSLAGFGILDRMLNHGR